MLNVSSPLRLPVSPPGQDARRQCNQYKTYFQHRRSGISRMPVAASGRTWTSCAVRVIAGEIRRRKTSRSDADGKSAARKTEGMAMRKYGGWGRNRTGVHGFAGRCMTTLPPSQIPERFWGLDQRSPRNVRQSIENQKILPVGSGKRSIMDWFSIPVKAPWRPQSACATSSLSRIVHPCLAKSATALARSVSSGPTIRCSRPSASINATAGKRWIPKTRNAVPSVSSA